MFSIGRKRREDERGMQRLNPHIRFSRDVMHYFEDASDSDEEDSVVQNTNQGSKSEAKTVNGLASQSEAKTVDGLAVQLKLNNINQ
jgi:hypothetical protein